MNTQLIQRFETILHRAHNTPVTVSLDWLSVLFLDAKKFVPEPGINETQIITDNISLHYTGKGNEHYKYIYHVLYQGEHLASLLCYTRNAKFVREGVVKLDFKNHLLYSADLWTVYDEIVSTFQLEYKNISRVDIAMDGMNYMCEFLNEYTKQKEGQTVVQRIARGRLGASVFDEASKKYQSFKIGTPKGVKHITMYNKTLDIVKTGKDYIQQYWKLNGLVTDTINIRGEQEKLKLHYATRRNLPEDQLLLKILEVLKVEGSENIYRFEIRLKGEAIKEIKDFTIDKLKTPDDLVSIVKLMSDTTFKFKQLTDKSNISRCRDLTVIPFENFNLKALDKLPRQERGHIYKAMLTCHLIVESMYTGKSEIDDFSNYGTLKNCIQRFDLSKWFARKLNNDWIDKYGTISGDVERTNDVTIFLYDMLESIETGKESSFDHISLEDRKASLLLNGLLEKDAEEYGTLFKIPIDVNPDSSSKMFIPGGFTPLDDDGKNFDSFKGIFLPGDYRPGNEDAPF